MTQLSDYYRDAYALEEVPGKFEIVKNFPERSQFTADVAAIGADVEWTRLRYFWQATFRLR
jgi:hypothetical protein